MRIFIKEANTFLEYELKRTNRRSGTYRVRIYEGKLTVYAPHDCPVTIIEEGLENKGLWLLEKLELSKQKMAAAKRDTILYRGQRYPLRLKRASVPRVRLADSFIVETPDFHPLVVEKILADWFKKEAERQIPPRVAALAKQIGASPNKISFRNQKTRWGSCSSLGNISLNIRLLMAPQEILDYVIVHELCHLLVPNHSARYWQLVESHFPKYKEARLWLKTNSKELTFNVQPMI